MMGRIERQPYHEPALLAESLDGLAIRPDGFYVDATYGGGGHSRAILDALGEDGKLMAFDQDADAEGQVSNDERLIFVKANFRYLRRFLSYYGIDGLDGVLADLGISFHQIDEGDRGFSYRFDAHLDMRMNRAAGKTAADVLNSYRADELQKLLGLYGEVRNARTVAQRIEQVRQVQPLRTTGDLVALLEPLIRGNRQRYLAQVFQALRIEVNDELGALREFLEQACDALKSGGRMAIISYHSLEDRLVKNFFKTGDWEGEAHKDFYGNLVRPLEPVTRRPIVPSPEEVDKNPRARSARLRVAEKK
ncbi:MAG: 16S rRNA (cytosine(1402)-N(4))-methyltransferase RsmH [Saprospiraceae bacterium]